MWPDDAFSQELNDRMTAWGGPQGGMADEDFRQRQQELAQLDDDMRFNEMTEQGGGGQVSYGSATGSVGRGQGTAVPQYEPPTPEELDRRRRRSKEFERERAERGAQEREQERLDRLNAVPDERLMRAATQPRQQSITGTGVSGFTTLILWALGICAAVVLLNLIF
ncbi:hypothetical protein OG786_21125 [Streptomyces sp. NBC_00101]|uniref:hypothetical protein n=1 Tax=Streptomyces sp. NBC_00101 TaxID=2975651 RepID=UPI003256511B